PHDLGADASLPHAGPDVHRDPELADALQERRDGDGRTAVRALDEGGDALAQVVLRRRHRLDTAAAVRVNVDEARRDHHAARIDAHGRVRARKIAYRRDGVAADADIAVEPWRPRTIHDFRARDQEVEAVPLRGQNGARHASQNESA